MAPPAQAQALLASLTAHAFFGKWRHDNDEADEDTMLEFGGVEIIVNEGKDNHSHAVYPHFDDNPDNKPVAYPAFDHAYAVHPHFDDNPNNCVAYPAFDHAHAVYPDLDDKPGKVAYPASDHAHAVYPHFDDDVGKVAYPAFDHAHAVYPHFHDEPNSRSEHRSVAYPTFDFKPCGLIGETLKDSTLVDHGGIANLDAGTKEEHEHASRTHLTFGSGAEENAEKVVGAHALYPVFESSARLIGGTAKDDAIIGHDGTEVIAKDCLEDPVASAVYPQSGDRSEHSTCAHAFYSALEDTLGGLIGEKSEGDAIISNRDVEIIASNHGESCLASAFYPYLANDESRLGAHAMYPEFVEEGGSLVGEKNTANVSNGFDGVNILSSKDYTVGNDAVKEFNYKNMDDVSAFRLDDLINGFGGKSKAAPPEVCGSASNCFMGWPNPLPNLKSDCSHSTLTENEKEMTWLLAAFFSLPREQVLNAMKAATSNHDSFDHNPGIHQHTCTGYGSWGEQCKAVGIRSPALVAVAS